MRNPRNCMSLSTPLLLSISPSDAQTPGIELMKDSTVLRKYPVTCATTEAGGFCDENENAPEDNKGTIKSCSQ